MKLRESAPPGWDARIASPLQSRGYAEATRALGYQPLFAETPGGLALVLVRRVPIPLVSRWTARAKVYAVADEPGFMSTLVDALIRLGVSHVKLGDSLWGRPSPPPPDRGLTRRVGYHVFRHDVRGGAEAVLAGAQRMIRRNVRKATARVTEVQSPADLRDYLCLAEETGARMRGRDVAAVYPAAYFEAIVREMVPRRQAVLLLARAGETPAQGPTAVFWHAMRQAEARGCRTFDMGAVTPTDDREHPHASVYEYKRLWGGRLDDVEGAELVVSPWKDRMQQALLAPHWDRCHPLYLRLFRPFRSASRAMVPALELSERERQP